MEKADILDMTLKFLLAIKSVDNSKSTYEDGYQRCATDAIKYLETEFTQLPDPLKYVKEYLHGLVDKPLGESPQDVNMPQPISPQQQHYDQHTAHFAPNTPQQQYFDQQMTVFPPTPPPGDDCCSGQSTSDASRVPNPHNSLDSPSNSGMSPMFVPYASPSYPPQQNQDSYGEFCPMVNREPRQYLIAPQVQENKVEPPPLEDLAPLNLSKHPWRPW